MAKRMLLGPVSGVACVATVLLCTLVLGQQQIRRRAVNPSGGSPPPAQPQVREYRSPGGTVRPPPGTPLPTSGYAGPFSGASRIEVRTSRMEFREPGSAWTTVGDLGLPAALETAWLVIRGMIKNELTHFFEKQPRDHRTRETLESIAGRNLYDLSITMADSSKATTLITVPQDGRSVTLQYRVSGNRMKFRAEVDNFFDPRITIDTTITLVVTLQASGDPQQPLRVSNAYIEMNNAKASVDGNIIHDVVKAIIEFVNRTDFERRIEGLVNGRRREITAEAAKGITVINKKLTPYSMQGASSLEFSFDRSRGELVLRMAPPTPVVSAR